MPDNLNSQLTTLTTEFKKIKNSWWRSYFYPKELYKLLNNNSRIENFDAAQVRKLIKAIQPLKWYQRLLLPSLLKFSRYKKTLVSFFREEYGIELENDVEDDGFLLFNLLYNNQFNSDLTEIIKSLIENYRTSFQDKELINVLGKLNDFKTHKTFLKSQDFVNFLNLEIPPSEKVCILQQCPRVKLNTLPDAIEKLNRVQNIDQKDRTALLNIFLDSANMTNSATLINVLRQNNKLNIITWIKTIFSKANKSPVMVSDSLLNLLNNMLQKTDLNREIEDLFESILTCEKNNKVQEAFCPFLEKLMKTNFSYADYRNRLNPLLEEISNNDALQMAFQNVSHLQMEKVLTNTLLDAIFEPKNSEKALQVLKIKTVAYQFLKENHFCDDELIKQLDAITQQSLYDEKSFKRLQEFANLLNTDNNNPTHFNQLIARNNANEKKKSFFTVLESRYPQITSQILYYLLSMARNNEDQRADISDFLLQKINSLPKSTNHEISRTCWAHITDILKLLTNNRNLQIGWQQNHIDKIFDLLTHARYIKSKLNYVKNMLHYLSVNNLLNLDNYNKLMVQMNTEGINFYRLAGSLMVCPVVAFNQDIFDRFIRRGHSISLINQIVYNRIAMHGQEQNNFMNNHLRLFRPPQNFQVNARQRPNGAAQEREILEEGQNTHVVSVHFATEMNAWILQMQFREKKIPENFTSLREKIGTLKSKKVKTALACLNRLENQCLRTIIRVPAKTKRNIFSYIERFDKDNKDLQALLPVMRKNSNKDSKIPLLDYIYMLDLACQRHPEYLPAMVNALHDIQRGYNTEDEQADLPICPDGTANKFAEHLANLSPLIHFVFVSTNSLFESMRSFVIQDLVVKAEEMLKDVQSNTEVDNLKTKVDNLKNFLEEWKTKENFFDEIKINEDHIKERMADSIFIYDLLNKDGAFDQVYKNMILHGIPNIPLLSDEAESFYPPHIIKRITAVQKSLAKLEPEEAVENQSTPNPSMG